MKSILLNTLILLFILLLFSNNMYSQRCGKKAACTIEIDDNYDYRGQSTYAILYANDTVRTKIVVYGGQNYNIFTCSEPQLGSIEFNVIKQYRKFRNVVEEINETEEILYELDEYGEYIYDEYGDYIEKARQTVYDTIWKKERYIEEDLLFNNLDNKDGASTWKKSVTKTESLVIEVIVTENATEGCLDLFVGHKTRSKGSFKR